MKNRTILVIHVAVFSLACLAMFFPAALHGQQKGAEKYLCSEPNPASVCTAANTCGSTSAACSVDVKKTANSAAVTPGIPGAKGNTIFCVKSGTTVTWKTESKNMGFVVDFGPNSPFDPSGAIIGGSDREVSTVAKKPGCYKYTAGGCVSGAIDGMCGSVDRKLVITE